MRIVELTAFHVRIPLKRPIRHASHRRTDTDNILVRCVLENKVEGYGEGVPREYVTGETVDTDMALLRRSELASQLTDCKSFEDAVALAERLRLAPLDDDVRGCKSNAARCAVELALLDAYGRHFGQPVSDVTRLLTPELYEPHSRVRYSGVITSSRGLKLAAVAVIMRLAGFHQLKVKVGIQGQNDVRRLRRVRRIVGRKVDIRVDANEAWTPTEAAARIVELEPIGITSVEQPLPHADLSSLGALRSQIRVPVMLDESLCSEHDARHALEHKTCDLFNLRLSKCGGFIRTLRLAQLAHKHGLGYQLGCQVGETALLSAAGRHFAASVAGIRYLEGSYDRHLVCEPLGTQDLTFGWRGWAPALTGPGLGITIDSNALQRVTLGKESLIG